MCPTIEISDALYAKLSRLAVGFEDTPQSVISRLVEANESAATTVENCSRSARPAEQNPCR